MDKGMRNFALIILVPLIIAGSLCIIVNHEMQYIDDSGESEEYDGRVNYTYSVADSFPGMTSFTKPDADTTLVIIKFTIANDNYKSGLYTDWWSVCGVVTINNVTYLGTSICTPEHYQYKDVQVMRGEQTTSITIVEIPRNLANEPMDVSLRFRDLGQWGDGLPHIVIDRGLDVPS